MDPKPLRILSHHTLFAVVRSGDLQALRTLLQGESEDRDDGIAPLMALRNDAGETALYVAADNNLEEIFRYLLQFCDLEVADIKTTVGINAFHIAAKHGNLGEIWSLLNFFFFGIRKVNFVIICLIDWILESFGGFDVNLDDLIWIC